MSAPDDAHRAAAPADARPAPAPPPTGADRADATTRRRTVSSDALFGGASEIHIRHRGSLYRLRQTALGKLILTK